MKWIGYIRERKWGRWRPAVSAPTWAEAWALLLRVGTAAQFCERIVVREGRKP